MRCILCAVPILLASFAGAAFADSVLDLRVTNVSIWVGPNYYGDNVYYSFSGPGVFIDGLGTFACNEWCSTPTGFAPGSTVGQYLGDLFPDTPNNVTLRGTSVEPYTLSFDSFFVASGDTIVLPQPGLSFSRCVGAGASPFLSGTVGFNGVFTQLNLTFPAGGTFCSNWAFDPVSGNYYFQGGHLVERSNVVPEPTSMSLFAIGVAGLLATWRRAKFRPVGKRR